MVKIMFDVGAARGEVGLQWLQQQKDVEVYAFEPSVNSYTALLAHQHANSRYHVYPFAVSSVDCDASDFYIARNSECNSLMKPKPSEELVQAWGFGRSDLFWTGDVQQVKTVRLDTFLAAHVPNVESIEYIHIDAQGMDLDVLMSLGSHVGLVKAGMVEAPGSSTRAIYSGQTYTVATIRQWLTANGFAVESVVPNDATGCEFNIRFRRRALLG